VGRIFITHYHVDHIGSAAALKEQTGAIVLAHGGDARVISGQDPLPPPNQGLMKLLFRIVPMMSRFDPVAPDRLVEDAMVLDILGGATVVHVPGHTPGSVALHIPSRGVLVCGDAIDHRGGRLGPPQSPFTVDQAQMLDSMRRLAELDFDVLCPGHGPPIAGGARDQVQMMLEWLA
jgi:glyoxylase-like metal-dependent hydrolase (beta-lactamase superfamily II)